MRVTDRNKGASRRRKNNTARSRPGRRPGKLTVVGIGPGRLDLLTTRAKEAIGKNDVIIGYKTYVDLVGDLINGKEIVASAMTQEVDRVKLALAKAREGKQVCLISSGDPGVYGMAGLALELLEETPETKIEIEIIPGVMAALSAASILGAPLMHDFAVISLSDLLTDMNLIERRIDAAAASDFVIAFYNPQSKKRKEPLHRAWQILMKYKSPQTPVGIVKNAERVNQQIALTTLADMLSPDTIEIDMTTTVIVGNSQTYLKRGKLITPRGYLRSHHVTTSQRHKSKTKTQGDQHPCRHHP